MTGRSAGSRASSAAGCPTTGSASSRRQAGRYHLYVARACPWAHRTIIARRLMGLEDAIGVSFVDPIRDERGWAFTGGEYVDPVNGFEFLQRGLRGHRPGYDARVTVPVLWDKRTGVDRQQRVGRHPADARHGVRAARRASGRALSRALRDEIDALNDRDLRERQQRASTRPASRRARRSTSARSRALFAPLDELDARLAGRRFLFGPEPVETDWRLFTTLVRFDAVYQIHFKCSLRKLIEYEHLWPYARDLYQWPGVGGDGRLRRDPRATTTGPTR